MDWAAWCSVRIHISVCVFPVLFCVCVQSCLIWFYFLFCPTTVIALIDFICVSLPCVFKTYTCSLSLLLRCKFSCVLCLIVTCIWLFCIFFWLWVLPCLPGSAYSFTTVFFYSYLTISASGIKEHVLWTLYFCTASSCCTRALSV